MSGGQKNVIGRTVLVDVSSICCVPAKTDTGADFSSIWASGVEEVDGKLYCTLFDTSSPYYTGERLSFTPGSYVRTRVASSSGHRQARYAVVLPVNVAGRSLDARFSLANRSTMLYPILLGCDMLAGRFLVDVGSEIPLEMREQLKHEKRLRSKELKAFKTLKGAS